MNVGKNNGNLLLYGKCRKRQTELICVLHLFLHRDCFKECGGMVPETFLSSLPFSFGHDQMFGGRRESQVTLWSGHQVSGPVC